MSKSDTLVHELRTLAGELRQVYEHSTDWLRDEAVTLASSVDCMREAADTIESLRGRLQSGEGAGIGECEMVPLEWHGLPKVNYSCSECDASVYDPHPNYCPSCGRRVKQ